VAGSGLPLRFRRLRNSGRRAACYGAKRLRQLLRRLRAAAARGQVISERNGRPGVAVNESGGGVRSAVWCMTPRLLAARCS